jgi:UDP-glucose 4-epimerase
MRVLVTGANGFIGGHLCPLLESSGCEVVRAVRTAQSGAVAVGNMDGAADWSAALRGVEAVVHLAARVHIINDTAADPLAAFRAVNVAGSLDLARQAVAAGIKRFVFISSIKVNGERTADGRSFTATDEPSPEDPYGISKYEAELGLRKIAEETGMELVVIRPPLVYGSGVGANFRRLIKLAASGIPLPLASIDNRRSLVCVENLCDLIFQCLKNPAAAGQTFLVSDDQDVSTPELLRMLAAASGKKIRLFPMSGKLLRLASRIAGLTAEVERLFGSLQVDISHTKETLGWKPPFSLQDGIKRTVGGA